MAFLSNRYKLLIQLTQTLLIVTVLILSVVRLLDRPAGAPRTRSNTIALGMSAKSLVIILYELLTEHVRSFQRWGSLKAYAILNALEVVFWGAVAFLMIQANTKFCQGTNCVLSWVIVALAVILNILASYTAALSYLNFRAFRAWKVRRETMPMEHRGRRASRSVSNASHRMEQGFGGSKSHSSHSPRHARPAEAKLASHRSGHRTSRQPPRSSHERQGGHAKSSRSSKHQRYSAQGTPGSHTSHSHTSHSHTSHPHSHSRRHSSHIRHASQGRYLY